MLAHGSIPMDRVCAPVVVSMGIPWPTSMARCTSTRCRVFSIRKAESLYRRRGGGIYVVVTNDVAACTIKGPSPSSVRIPIVDSALTNSNHQAIAATPSYFSTAIHLGN